ncbi:MAG: hypothetical protein A2145_00260 [candidate division Zixibacteria bacterium RBG_16_40_9]|nr:MAG: hypothetical protein A2145_00260 [candidate division Zixibacteria bacterium RBG_16_40_9]
MKYQVKINGQEFKIDILERGNRLQIGLNGREMEANLTELKKDKIYSLLVDNKTYDLEILRKMNDFEINYGGRKYSGEIWEHTLAKIKPPAQKEVLKQKELKAPMPGLIVRIEVPEGKEIKIGEGVLIMEAMKMENEIKSPFDGKVKKILVQERQTVEKDQVLVVLE